MTSALKKQMLDIKLSCISVDLNTQLINATELVNFVLQTIA